MVVLWINISLSVALAMIIVVLSIQDDGTLVSHSRVKFLPSAKLPVTIGGGGTEPSIWNINIVFKS